MKTQKNILTSIVTVLVLSLQLVSPITVHADDGTTPPQDSTPEVTTTPDPTDVTDAPQITSTPLPPELTADPVEMDIPIPPTDSTEVPIGLPVTTASAPGLVEPVTTEEVIGGPTAAEVLAEIPLGTDIVVLNDNGEPESLVTQEAAEIITTGDPMWCPTGVLPGGDGCTPSFNTVTELNVALSSGMYTGAGTVYFASTYSTNDVTFDGDGLYYLSDLTIQGGWNGLTGSSFALLGNTIFTVPISIINWDWNVTVNNVTVDGAVGTGLVIKTNGADVNINDSSFINNQYDAANSDSGSDVYYGDGAYISPTGGNITVEGSNFDGNYWDGLWIVDAGQSNITNSTFRGNLAGLRIFEYYRTSDVAISDSVFSGNSEGIIADTTDMYGVSIGTIYFNLNCVQFMNNEDDIVASGDIMVTDNPCSPPDRDNDGIIDSEDACPDIPGIKTDDPLTNGCPQQPQIIPVEGNSISFPIDCSLFSSHIPVWSNGDRILISCVPNGTVTIDRVENTNLPGGLDEGYQYASGFMVQVFQDEAPLSIMPEDGYIQVSFVAEENDAEYGIMYWDENNSDWILLEEYQPNPNGTAMQFPLGTEDSRTIKSGTQFTSGNPNRENVTTNFTGTYVLVVQE